MAESLVFNGNSSITKGTVIFEKGQPLQSTALILKGRVIVQGEGVRMTIGSGNFWECAMFGKRSIPLLMLHLMIWFCLGCRWKMKSRQSLLLEQKPQYRGL